MNKLDKFKIQHTISDGISIVELDVKQGFEGLSLLKEKSEDKSNEAILAVMSFLKGKTSEDEPAIKVESSLGSLTFERAK